MSTKLLKRLLQQTNDFSVSPEDDGNEHTKNVKRRKKKDDHQDLQPLGKEELIDRQVQSMLRLDSKMASRGMIQKKSEKRINAKQRRESKLRKKLPSTVVGNSRAASSQLRIRPERTSDKKKYEKQKEANKLKRIAKLLKKTKPMKF